MHTHEVYFRDTAHGLLVWAVAVVITAAFLGAAVSLIVGSRTKLAATTAAVGAIAATPSGGETVPGLVGNSRAEAAPMFGPLSALATPGGYLTDLLLRGDRNPAEAGLEGSKSATSSAKRYARGLYQTRTARMRRG